MNRTDLLGDLSYTLYLAPIIVSGIYGIALATLQGVFPSVSSRVFLSVTKNPYIFLIGYMSTLLFLLVEVHSHPKQSRTEAMRSSARSLDKMAGICFLLALLSAWGSVGYSGDPGDAMSLLAEGRYSIIFPLALLVTGRAIPHLSTSQVSSKSVRDMLPIIVTVASVPAFLGLAKLGMATGLAAGVSFLLLTAGSILIYLVGRKG